MKRIIALLLVLISIITLASCNNSSGFKYIEGKVNIVATTTMVGDLAKQLGKEHVSVTTIMNVGVDPHSFVPRPSVTNAIKKADLVVTNGLYLEAKMGKVLTSLKSKLIEVGSFIPENDLIKDEFNEVDPHIWFDVDNWIVISEGLTNKLIEIDKLNEESYLNNLNIYKEKLINLDLYVKEEVNKLPLDNRVLITAHDAFSYFGKAYGFEVLSIQGISTETEASGKDISELANLIVSKNVKAIFLESSIPENTIKAVIDAAKVKGHDVSIGGTLYSDSLGKIDSDVGTYIGMIKYNINTIIEGLR